MTRPFLSLLVLCGAAVLAGCASDGSSRQPEALPAVGFYAPFQQEVATLGYALPCQWQHGKAPALDGQTYDYGCHGGRWGSVSLLVDSAEHAPDYIERVRLIWRAWPEQDPRISDADIAEVFATELANRFVAPAYSKQTVEKFMRGEKMNWQSDAATLTISRQPEGREVIHRLEIRARTTPSAS